MHRVHVLLLVALTAVASSVGAQVAGDPGAAAKGKSRDGAAKSSPQDPLTVGPTIYRLILENDRVRVMEVRFKPGEKIAAHSHPDHVVVVTAAGRLAVTSASGTQEIDAKVGEAFFFPAETHSAQNVGTTEFACVVTELKGKPKAKDQASPKPVTTDVQQGKVDG